MRRRTFLLGLGALGLGTQPPAGVVASAVIIGFARAGTVPLMFLEIMDDDDIAIADVGAATGLFFAVAAGSRTSSLAIVCSRC